jgi:hypothetical protein
MVKIFVNHNKEDLTYSYTQGQAFPVVEGKLLRVEMGGAELARLMEEKEIPLFETKGLYLVWQGRQAGSILKLLRELFDKTR